ncbi:MULTISPECIES: hypothetical protein [unclassified Pseudomonas]|uniref:hypothetical protein n=1 Tax=unclassified Pseudomonas TaxID=196821 RepID=UPI0010E5365D|nr:MULTISPECIES: hypothetical protein [unclassified Pseudomonas]VII92403.1 phage-related hypothetical protein [Pseudomonas sp. FG-3G]
MSSALKGKRDQAFLIEPHDAMDAMPNKRLVADTLEADGQFCTLGVLSAKRSIEMSVIDAHCRETVSGAFRIAPAMAAEVVFENDECGWNETPEQRWQRMRKWIGSHIKEVTP